MSYSKLAQDIHDQTGLRVDVTAAVIREIVAHVLSQIRRGEVVRVPGLGTIRGSYRKPKRVVCNLPDSRLHGREFTTPFRIAPFLEPCTGTVRDEHIDRSS